jgi:cobalamin synthase
LHRAQGDSRGIPEKADCGCGQEKLLRTGVASRKVNMIRRFVSASAIACIAIAVAVLVVLLIPALPLHKVYLLPTVWCFAPLAWGLWAMLAPSSWVPQRLPIWGTMLGLVAGLLVGFVINLPARILGAPVPPIARAVGVLVIVVVYYLLWMLVRVVYRALGGQTSGA